MTVMVEVFGGILGAAALIAAITVIGKGIRWFWKDFLKPAATFFRDWFGEEARSGISPGRPGVMIRLTTVETAVTDIKEALEIVARMESRLGALENQITELRTQQPVGAVVTGIGFQADRSTAPESATTVPATRRY